MGKKRIYYGSGRKVGSVEFVEVEGVFVQVYVGFSSRLMLLSKGAIQVLFWLIDNRLGVEGEIQTYNAWREFDRDLRGLSYGHLSMKQKSFQRCMCELSDCGILRRLYNGVYEMDEKLVWKGSERERDKKIKDKYSNKLKTKKDESNN